MCVSMCPIFQMPTATKSLSIIRNGTILDNISIPGLNLVVIGLKMVFKINMLCNIYSKMLNLNCN